MARVDIRRGRGSWRRRARLCLLGALPWVAGCPIPPPADGSQNDGTDAPGGETQGYRPGVDTTWQWQLQPDADGNINTSYGVDLYDLDLFETPVELIQRLHADGKRVIAYFSAGTFEDFRPDSAEFAAAELGEPLEDFADERWLDVRSSNVRTLMQARLDLAAEKGFDGVEPDNVDGYANDSGFDLSAADQLDFNRFIAAQAHARGLAVGLKNDLDQIPDLVDAFDFAVNEQCHEFDECDALAAFIDAGKPVFNAEYLARYANDAAARQEVCDDAAARRFQTLILPLDLDDSFRFACGS